MHREFPQQVMLLPDRQTQAAVEAVVLRQTVVLLQTRVLEDRELSL
jgi:hypothetical protein